MWHLANDNHSDVADMFPTGQYNTSYRSFVSINSITEKQRFVGSIYSLPL